MRAACGAIENSFSGCLCLQLTLVPHFDLPRGIRSKRQRRTVLLRTLSFLYRCTAVVPPFDQPRGTHSTGMNRYKDAI